MQKIRQGKLSHINLFSHLHAILRCPQGGREIKSTLPLDLKFPIILPKYGVTTLHILDYCHGKTQHQGRGQTLNELTANGFWIVIHCGSNNKERSAVNECMCHLHKNDRRHSTCKNMSCLWSSASVSDLVLAWVTFTLNCQSNHTFLNSFLVFKLVVETSFVLFVI